MPGRDKERDGCIGLFAVYILAFIVFAIGFSSAYWIWDDTPGSEYFEGLWRYCGEAPDGDIECNRIDLSQQEGWYKTVASFMIVALSLAVFGGVVTIWNPLAAALQLSAGAFGLAGTIWYALENDHLQDLPNAKLHWAFWLSFCGAVLFLLNGTGLLILSIKQRCSMRQQLPCRSSEVDPI